MIDYKALLEEKMKKSGIKLSEPIVADGQFHVVESYYYMLDTITPVAALYGRLDGSEPETMTFKLKSDTIRTKRDQKVEDMKRIIEKSITVNQERADRAESELNSNATTVNYKANNDIDDGSVERLTKLTAFDYDRVRKKEALRLNIRVSTLDKAIDEIKKLSLSIDTLGPRLLSDAMKVFNNNNVKLLSTKELIAHLCREKNSIWSVYNRGENINDKQVAYILKHYGVKSRDHRFADGVFKGYSESDFFEATCDNLTTQFDEPQLAKSIKEET